MPPAPSSDSPAPDTELSDAGVVERVLAGDTQSYGLLIARYNQRLYRVGRAYLRDHDGVEDAMQNTYVKAYRNLNQFRHGSMFSTWLTRVMINECLMTLRKARARREDQVEQEKFDRLPSLSPTGSETSQLSEMKALLEAAIAELPLAYRAVYLLRDVQHLTTSDTARCLGISLVSAKVRLHRARALLKEKLMATAAGSEVFAYDARYCAAMTERVMRILA